MKYDRYILNLEINKLSKKEVIDKLLTIVEDYEVDVDKYFVFDLIIDKDVEDVFNYFNSFKIKCERDLSPKLVLLIKKYNRSYGKENVLKYIRRYAKVYFDQNYYFSYRWNLTDFMSRKEGLNAFMDNGSKWQNYISQRPLIDTSKYFDFIWDYYPNKLSIEKARLEFDKKFVGINDMTSAKKKALEIYNALKKYVEASDENYLKNLGNWLAENIANGKNT